MIARLLAWALPWLWPVAGIAFAGVSVFAGMQTVGRARAEAATANVQARWDADRAQAAAAALKQTTEYRAEEERRIAVQKKESIDEAERKITEARADAAGADAAAERLRSRIAALVAAARQAARNPAPAGASTPAGDPIGVLADVLSRSDARSGLLARVADERGIAGTACVAAYEALTPR